MKTEKEVKLAWDVMSAEIERLQSSGKLEHVFTAIAVGQAREVLCWVLEHGHSNGFAENLNNLRKHWTIIDGNEGGLNKCQKH